jgi:hypothetical protein
MSWYEGGGEIRLFQLQHHLHLVLEAYGLSCGKCNICNVEEFCPHHVALALLVFGVALRNGILLVRPWTRRPHQHQ